MNERIKELAQQAKGFVDLNQHVGGEGGCMVYTYDGLEKFAELIVKECAKKIESVKDAGVIPRGVHLYDHFGIEE